MRLVVVMLCFAVLSAPFVSALKLDLPTHDAPAPAAAAAAASTSGSESHSASAAAESAASASAASASAASAAQSASQAASASASESASAASAAAASAAAAATATATATPAATATATPQATPTESRSLEQRLDEKKDHLKQVDARLEELANTINDRDEKQKTTAEALWPFFDKNRDARESLAEFFRYSRRAFIAKRNKEFAAEEADAAGKSEIENAEKAKPHLEVVKAHITGNQRANVLFVQLQQERENLWSAMHLKEIKEKQKAALVSSIAHLSARLAVGEHKPDEATGDHRETPAQTNEVKK